MSKTIKVQSKPFFFLKNNDMDRLSSDLIVYIYSFLPRCQCCRCWSPHAICTTCEHQFMMPLYRPSFFSQPTIK